MIPITIEGNTYKSISAAWRAESPPGLPMVTVRWRLNRKWPTLLAFTMEAIEGKDRRAGIINALAFYRL